MRYALDLSSTWPGRLARSCEGSSGRDARATSKSHGEEHRCDCWDGNCYPRARALPLLCAAATRRTTSVLPEAERGVWKSIGK